jgi:hypothetical protein
MFGNGGNRMLPCRHACTCDYIYTHILNVNAYIENSSDLITTMSNVFGLISSLFLTVLEAGYLGLRYCQDWFLAWPPSLAFFLCLHMTVPVSVCVLISFSYKSSYVGLGSTHWLHLTLIIFLKVLFPNNVRYLMLETESFMAGRVAQVLETDSFYW